MSPRGKSNEWYTPAHYIEAAREVMRGIDLDPASCEQANRTVKATRYYSKEDNGLMHPWHIDGKPARVWLNPPYGRIHPELTGSTRSYQLIFGAKLLQEYGCGHVEQAILLLLGNACFTRWFHQHLWNFPLCFHEGHIDFSKPDGTTASFGFGTIFAYLGPNEATFAKVFSQFGRIAKALDTPKETILPRSLWELLP